MQIIGLTGGIGSGKTTVARIFSTLGIPVYNSDLRAKSILETDLNVQSDVRKLVGKESIENGIVNRKLIAEKSFNNRHVLQQLNTIIHPRVAEDFIKWKNEHKSSPYLIKEAAILFESGSYKSCDKVVFISTELETRVQRVMQRDGVGRAEVESRISNQWPEEKKANLSTFIVHNNESDALIPQVVEIHEKLLNENS